MVKQKTEYLNYKEPFKEVEDGYGAYGVLSVDTETKSLVQCHICGELFKFLPHHVWSKHRVKINDYKEKYGFPRNMSLLTEKYIDEKRKTFEQNVSDDAAKRGLSNYRKLVKEGKIKRKPWKRSVANRNKNGICEAQLENKVKLLAEQLGHSPTRREMKQHLNLDRGVFRTQFGSYNKFLKKVGLPARPKGINELRTDTWTNEQIEEAIRQFYAKHERSPRSSDFKSINHLPAREVIARRYSTMNNARRIAGVPEVIRAGKLYEYVEVIR